MVILHAHPSPDENAQATHLIEIQGDNQSDYESLTKEEKDELAREFKEEKDGLIKIPRVTARSRRQEVTNTVRNIRQLVRGSIEYSELGTTY